MSKISSTTLFHFMKKKEWLIKTLSEMEMTPRYVLEDYPPTKEKYLILMKCFCDIPLSNISHHTNIYGKYGIGLSKIFAFENYISPVQYFHESSHPMYALMTVDFKKKDDFTFLISHYKYMYSSDKSVYYYEEREWRYVLSQTIDVTEKSHTEIESIRTDLNGKVDKKLKIHFDDIEYVFVENKKDLLELIDEIEKMNYTRTEKNILISKIITIEQIEIDF